jgi:hypothetical protein
MNSSSVKEALCPRNTSLPQSSGWRGNRASRVHLVLQHTPPSAAWFDVQPIVGTWLSLVERTLGVGEVASSNLVVPTI